MQRFNEKKRITPRVFGSTFGARLTTGTISNWASVTSESYASARDPPANQRASASSMICVCLRNCVLWRWSWPRKSWPLRRRLVRVIAFELIFNSFISFVCRVIYSCEIWEDMYRYSCMECYKWIAMFQLRLNNSNVSTIFTSYFFYFIFYFIF